MSLTLRLNIIVSVLLVVIFVAVFFNILYSTADNVSQEVDGNFDLSQQIVNEKIKSLRTIPIEIVRPYPYVDITPEHILYLLKLDSFSDIKYITIELYDNQNRLIKTNHDGDDSSSLHIPDKVKRFLLLAFDEQDRREFRTINIGTLKVGSLIISTDGETELRDIWYKTLSTLTPVMVFFFILSLALTFIITTIIKPVIEFIKAVNRERQFEKIHGTNLFRLSHLLRLPNHLQGIRHEMQNSSRKVHELNNRILDLQEEERRRISAELHDELGQHLTAIRFEAELIRTAENMDDVHQSAESIDDIGRTMKDIVRSMLQRLRPADIDNLGLKGAIQELLVSWQLPHPDTVINFECQADFSAMTDTEQLNIYRIIQEGLTNISRHAGAEADKVNILIKTNNDQITISITDNGQGCDLGEQVNGFGLIGMRERVDVLSGQLTLISNPGNGMEIIVDIPTKGEKINE